MRQGTNMQPTKLSFVSHRHCTMQNSFHLSQFYLAEPYPELPGSGLCAHRLPPHLPGPPRAPLTWPCLSSPSARPLTCEQKALLYQLVARGLYYSSNLRALKKKKNHMPFLPKCCNSFLVLGAVYFVNDKKTEIPSLWIS